ncbi:hypothetical protein GUITHDRAFT_156388, partial [Guillardia theta CCMP2712]
MKGGMSSLGAFFLVILLSAVEADMSKMSGQSSPDASSLHLRKNTYSSMSSTTIQNPCDNCDWMCEMGFYLDKGTSPYNWVCKQCPSNSYSNMRGAPNVSSCKCNAGYAGTDGTCDACAAGKYSSVYGLTACLSCTAGTNFSSATGATTCTACNTTCPAGSYKSGDCTASQNLQCATCSSYLTYSTSVSANSGAASSVCVCDAGYYYNSTSSTCIACEAGKYKSDKSNAAMCTECNASTYSMAGQSTCYSCASPSSCNTGYYLDPSACSNSQYTCQQCKGEGGQLSDSPRNSSTDCYCGLGYYYKDATNGCTKCPAGKFGNETKLTQCYDCTEGVNYANVEGLQSCIACTQCSATQQTDQTCTKTTQASCRTCPANSALASGKCTCNDGYAGDASTSTGNCTMCAAGKYSNSSFTTCVDCPTDTWSAQKSGSCSACNQTVSCQSDEIASSTCDQTTGRYCTKTCSDSSKSILNSVCVCKAGYYQNASGDNCVACPAGKYQGSENQTTCHTCDSGKYAAGNGNTMCHSCGSPCGAGKYVITNCSITADINCGTCDAGKTSNSGAMHVSDCYNCSAGYYSNAGGSCMQCAIGKYNPYPGMSDCQSCLAGNWAPPGSTSMAHCTSTRSLTCSNIPEYAVINPDIYSYYETSSSCSMCPTSCPSGNALNGTCAGKGVLGCISCPSSCKLNIYFTATTNKTTPTVFNAAVKGSTSWTVTSTSTEKVLMTPSVNYTFTTFVTTVEVSSGTESAYLSFSKLKDELAKSSVQLLSIDSSIQYKATSTTTPATTAAPAPATTAAPVYVYMRGTAAVTEAQFKANEADFKKAITNAALPVVVSNVVLTILSVTARRASQVEYSAQLQVASASDATSAQNNIKTNIATEIAKYSSLSAYSTSFTFSDTPYTTTPLGAGSQIKPLLFLFSLSWIIAISRSL